MIKEDIWKLCLAEAKKADKICRPNPAVGSVLTDGKGNILSKGYTKKWGSSHAEVDCLVTNINKLISKKKSKKIRFAKDVFKDSHLFVTLTPCSHYGKTPPCVELILKKEIEHLHIALNDPNPLINKKALKVLKQSGVNVYFDCPKIIQKKLFELNKIFFMGGMTTIEKHRPWITLKYAMTLDGKIATRAGDSQWISSEYSRKKVHGLRSLHDAILTGEGTIWVDNPQLNIRHGVQCHRSLPRVILLKEAKLSGKERVFTDGNPSYFIYLKNIQKKINKLSSLVDLSVVKFICMPSKARRINILKLLEWMVKEKKWNSLFVEGGARMLGEFSSCFDELHTFIHPSLLVDGQQAMSPFSLPRTISKKLEIQKAQMKNKFPLRTEKVELNKGGDIYINTHRIDNTFCFDDFQVIDSDGRAT